MPEISGENVIDKEWLETYNHNRFIRIGEKFFYEDDYRRNHASIAIVNGVTEVNRNNEPIVDDAGDIQIVNGKLAFGGFSISCAYKDGDFTKARPVTNEVAKKIFGEENIY
jgi:hypothetical protein